MKCGKFDENSSDKMNNKLAATLIGLHSDAKRGPPGSPFLNSMHDPYLFLVDSNIIRSVSQASSCHPLALCNVLMSLYYSSTVIVLYGYLDI